MRLTWKSELKLRLSITALRNVMFLLVIFPCHATDNVFSQNEQDYYLDKIIIERSESYLVSSIRKFRSFPHLDKAYRLMEENRYAESKIQFQNFFKIDPLDIKARIAYVIMLYKIKAYQAVIQQTDLAINQIGKCVPFLQYRALAHHASGEKAKALADFNSIITNEDVLDEDKLFAIDMSLLILLEQKSYQQSIDFFEQYPTSKRDFNYFVRYAVAREGLGEFNLAEEMYDKALLEAHTQNEALKIYLALGGIYQKNKSPYLAISAYQSALTIDRGNPEGLRSLANIYYNLGQLDKAIQMMDMVINQQYDVDDKEFLANLFYANQDYLSAAKSYDMLRSKQTQDTDLHRTYMLMGYAYSNAKQHAMAAEAFQNAAEISQTSEVIKSLASALERKGNTDQAIKVYRNLLHKEKNADTYIKLSNLYTIAGDIDNALKTLDLTLESNASEDQKKTVYRSQGELFYQKKEFVLAKTAFQNAVKIGPTDPELLNSLARVYLQNNQAQEASDYLRKSLAINESTDTLLLLAEVEKNLGNWEESVKIYLHLIQLNDLHFEQKSNALTDIGLLYTNNGHERLALEYLTEAASIDEQNWKINQILGNTYASLDEWNNALEQFQAALSKQENLDNLLNFAKANDKLNKPGIATHYFHRALEQAENHGANTKRKKTVLDKFGFFLLRQKEYEQAAENWRQSLQIQDDPVIKMRLAIVLGSEFNDSQSLNQLESIDNDRLSTELNAERYDFIAQQYAKKKQFVNAINAQKKAFDFIKSPQRHYMLGNYFQSNQQHEKALEQFEFAVDYDPGNKTYSAALGYSYSNNNQLNQSIQILENVAKQGPENLQLYKDLAYLNLKNADNKASEYWFKQTIDAKITQLNDSPGDTIKEDKELFDLKSEVRELADNLNITAYTNYRQNNNTINSTAAGNLGGAIPSQGGVELDYRPPTIGLRDRRTFTFFSRMLWSMEPDSFKVDSETFQATLGVRYKPFKKHNFNLSTEKLLKIGNKSQDNWLVRGRYGWTNGFGINFGKKYWNYTTLFGDLGYFVQSPAIVSFYGEARQGISLNLWNNLILTPHAVIDGRIQTKDDNNLSYLEAGGGLSFKFLFNQTRYSAPKSYLELLFQYKAGIVAIDSGFNATGVIRY